VPWCSTAPLMGSSAPEVRLPPPGALYRAAGAGALHRARGAAAALVPAPRPRFGCRSLVVSTVPEARLPRPGVSIAPLMRSAPRARVSAAVPWCRSRSDPARGLRRVCFRALVGSPGPSFAPWCRCLSATAPEPRAVPLMRSTGSRIALWLQTAPEVRAAGAGALHRSKVRAAPWRLYRAAGTRHGPELRLPHPGASTGPSFGSRAPVAYRSTGPEICAAPWCRCRCAGAAAALLALHRIRGAAAPAAGDSTAPEFRAVAAAPVAREWRRVLVQPPRFGPAYLAPSTRAWLPPCLRRAPRRGSVASPELEPYRRGPIHGRQ